MNLPLANNHISVDCVVFGFDGSDLNALLIQRKGEHNGYQYEDMKLPGRLIYQDEDLDAAAARTLKELAGFRNVRLMQFKTYGSMNRTRDMRDVLWLEKEQDARVDRIVTVAYVAFVKIERALARIDHRTKAVWVKMDQVGSLAFDHNRILTDGLRFLRSYIDAHPIWLFDMLPRKFTITQLRKLYEVLGEKPLDVRNFHKTVAAMGYVIPLDEYETGVAHRAARYYRFDKVSYNKTRR